MKYKEVTCDEVYTEYQKVGTVHLIDVREPDEFASIRTPLSRNLPLSQLSDPGFFQELSLNKKEPVYLICRSGKRSARACELFAEQGFERLYNVSGGMLAWEAGILPIECS